ncbi:MAG: ABC transporter permease [Gammaproteobacteria bacterium]
MNFEPVIFWTDALVFLLIGVMVGVIFYSRKKEHLLGPWRQVVRSRLGLSTLIILMAYVSVGLLDSFHYRPPIENADSQAVKQYSAEVLSVFDKMVTPLRIQVEKSYSKPFATHLFSKETLELENGERKREYPRLDFGGRHLESPATEKWKDIIFNVALALIEAVAVSAVMTMIVATFVSRKHLEPFVHGFKRVVYGDTEIPWNVVLLTVGVLLIVLMIVVNLGGKYHILGTDQIGKDVLYLSLKSIRTGLIIGTLTTLVMLPFAVVLGIMAGYFRGWVDDIIQYIYTTLNSIPGILLIAAMVLTMHVYMDNHPDLFETISHRADMRLLFLCFILGITSWTGLCRLLRGETMKLREVDYIQSATAFGVKSSKILGKHILPNVFHVVLIAVVIDFSGLVLAEAVLSYIGIGVDPSMNSWGNMINQARLEMAREPLVWWSLLSAFFFMFTLVLSANIFSDTIRDAFDPRLRKQ